MTCNLVHGTIHCIYTNYSKKRKESLRKAKMTSLFYFCYYCIRVLILIGLFNILIKLYL